MKQTPQVEKGYIRIATGDKDNDVLLALIGAKLGGTELAIILYVIRQTWGWGKKEDWISLTRFEKNLHRTRSPIIKAIKQLVLKKILVSKKIPGIKTTYNFNKDFSSWKLQPVLKKTPVSKKTLTSAKKDTTPVLNLALHTIKRNSTKETITKEKYTHLTDLKENDFSEIANRYNVPISFVKSKYEDMMLWEGEKSGRGKGRNWRLTLMNWVKRDSIKIRKEYDEKRASKSKIAFIKTDE